MINKYFNRVFLINLERRKDRLADSVRELGANDIEAHLFPAFDNPANGHAGCTRSHRMLIREIADGPWSRVLVLEDDIAAVTKSRLLVSGFKAHQSVWKTHCSVMNGLGTMSERFGALIPFLPDKWDVLYLGAGYGEPPISRHNEHVIRCAGMKTTGCYGITKEFAQKWTERVGPDLDKHPGCIDDVFSAMARDFLFYVLQPRLAFQRKSPSDITGEENSYLYSMTDPTHEQMV